MLPEERLPVAAQWTGKGVAAAEQLDDPAVLSRPLAMHGNELRKSGRPTRAVTTLERATLAAPHDRDIGAALAFLARAAGELGDVARFTAAMTGCHDLIDSHGPPGPLLDPFTCQEIHLRGLLDLGDLTGAVALAETAPTTAAPAPQGDVIARITYADVLLAVGDRDQAEGRGQRITVSADRDTLAL